MPGLKDIRSRIASTKNTQQITRAMKMVSAAKLRRAQNNIVSMRPYAKQLLSAIADIAITQRVEHPLLTAGGERKKMLLVVLTSDRGLCGAFNNSINRYAETYYRENKKNYQQVDILFVGRKGADYFKRRKIEGKDTITNLVREISYDFASKVSDRLMNNYLSGEYDEIRIIYNEFKSALDQRVTNECLFPVDLTKATLESQSNSGGFAKDLLFEPEPAVVVEELLNKHFTVQVYRCMSESVAAEHGARMTAMENATKNAGEMIRILTLTYNKLRQASITKELIEITSGAEALD